MSHFVVLVVGDDVAGQLAPYHEYECTGHLDEYVKDVDITDEVRAYVEKFEREGVRERQAEMTPLEAALEYCGINDAVVEDEAKAVRELETYKWGFAVVCDGKLVKAVRRTNPSVQWDWYAIGGRWKGWFRVKPCDVTDPTKLPEGARLGVSGVFNNEADSGTADQLYKRDVDVEFARELARREAEEYYDKVEAATAGIDPPDYTWPDLLEKHAKNIDAAREEYHSHPWIIALRKADLGFFGDVMGYLCVRTGGREEFVRRQVAGVMVPYAYVKDGLWYSKGEMGWWGLSDDKMSANEWNDAFWAMWERLPDDTFVTAVDCHI